MEARVLSVVDERERVLKADLKNTLRAYRTSVTVLSLAAIRIAFSVLLMHIDNNRRDNDRIKLATFFSPRSMRLGGEHAEDISRLASIGKTFPEMLQEYGPIMVSAPQSGQARGGFAVNTPQAPWPTQSSDPLSPRPMDAVQFSRAAQSAYHRRIVQKMTAVQEYRAFQSNLQAWWSQVQAWHAQQPADNVMPPPFVPPAQVPEPVAENDDHLIAAVLKENMGNAKQERNYDAHGTRADQALQQLVHLGNAVDMEELNKHSPFFHGVMRGAALQLFICFISGPFLDRLADTILAHCLDRIYPGRSSEFRLMLSMDSPAGRAFLKGFAALLDTTQTRVQTAAFTLMEDVSHYQEPLRYSPEDVSVAFCVCSTLGAFPQGVVDGHKFSFLVLSHLQELLEIVGAR